MNLKYDLYVRHEKLYSNLTKEQAVTRLELWKAIHDKDEVFVNIRPVKGTSDEKARKQQHKPHQASSVSLSKQV